MVLQKKKIWFSILILLVTLIPLIEHGESETIDLVFKGDLGVDIDDDGFYEFLDIELEVFLETGGLFIIQTGEILDSNEEPLQISATEILQLEAGENEVTIRFDGRLIHTSEKNPERIQNIDLIKEDYLDAAFLYDVELSQEYNWSDFQPPPVYDVGVAPGDWMIFQVYQTVTSTIPAINGSIGELNLVKINVREIQKSMVFLDFDFFYASGEQINQTTQGYLERSSNLFPFLIPSNLEKGSTIGEVFKIKINESVTSEVLGTERKILILTENQTNHEIDRDEVINQEYFWDSETGVLINSSYNEKIHYTSSEDVTHYNYSFQLYSSNLISQRTSIELEVEYLEENLYSVSARLMDYHGHGISDESLTFQVDKQETVNILTDGDGYASETYEVKKAGLTQINVMFPGSQIYQTVEAEGFIEGEGEKGSFNTIFIVLLVILVIVIVVFLKRYGVI